MCIEGSIIPSDMFALANVITRGVWVIFGYTRICDQKAHSMLHPIDVLFLLVQYGSEVSFAGETNSIEHRIVCSAALSAHDRGKDDPIPSTGNWEKRGPSRTRRRNPVIFVAYGSILQNRRF
ncbi:hypothetical protein LIA77_04872 [Sarocladium implicatum]|nr:hypothetical protein LIA77_04872 [Sarocladium implicatum]